MQLSRPIQAFLLLAGTIVGVGMFAMPFVFQRAGFLVGALELAVLAAVTVVVHRAYTEVVLATPTLHRLPGYVKRYLGERAAWLSRLSYLAGLSGTLLVYVILGGTFLGALIRWLAPAAPAGLGPFFFYLFGVGVIFRNIRFEGLVNAFLTLALGVALAALAASVLPEVAVGNLYAIDVGRFALPYGVILFALAGSAVIPDLKRVLGRKAGGMLPGIVVGGTLVPAALYLLFAAAVVGALGSAVTPDAISGLAARFGTEFLVLGSLVGFLAAITSFIGLGIVLEGTFVSDFRMDGRTAWVLTAAIPAAFYFLGVQDFIAIIGLIGAVAVGLDSLMILLVHRAAGGQNLIPLIRGVLIVVFLAGIGAALAGAVR